MTAARTTTPTHDAATAAVQAAANLMLRCDGYWRDDHDRRLGIEIDYAIDVDVIALFSDPRAKSKYAKVFDSDEVDGTQSLLARMLGEFILTQLPGVDAKASDPGSLLILSPHDDELDRMILAIAERARTETSTVENLLLEFGNSVDESRLDNVEALATEIIERAPEIVEKFAIAEGSHLEARRLASLPRGRLLNAARFSKYLKADARGSWKGDDSPLPPRGDIDSPERARFLEMTSQWRERLSAQMTGRKPQYALRGDAIALATIQWANECFARHKVKRRLVLITGSEHLFNAAKAARVIGKDFAPEFLRHPLAFAASHDFFAQSDVALVEGAIDARLALLHWLNLFFPEVVRQEGDYGFSVDKAVLDQIASNEDPDFSRAVTLLRKSESKNTDDLRAFPDGMIRNWRSVIRSATIYDELTRSESDPLSSIDRFKALLSSHFSAGGSIAELANEIKQRTESSLSALLLNTSRLGVMQLRNAPKLMRGFPALRFDAPYEAAQSIADELTDAFLNQAALDVRLDVARLYDELHKIDDADYHALVIHALAYAGTEHWFGARTLCLSAIGVSDRIPENERNFRLGREAAYLLAVAQRRLAESPDDLVLASNALSEARRRDPASTQEDIRFAAEELAQVAWRWQYAFYVKNDVLVIDFATYFESIRSLLRRANREPLPAVKNWVTRQLTTNAIFVGLLRLQIFPDTESTDSSREFLEILKARELSPDWVGTVGKGPHCDEVSDFAYWVATAVWPESPTNAARAKQHINELRTPSRRLPSFDKQRKGKLIALVNRRALL